LGLPVVFLVLAQLVLGLQASALEVARLLEEASHLVAAPVAVLAVALVFVLVP
jgi:hypothetical protein